eukprot:TRINITY_DN35247_c0_g1_i1.p1 TRINITY_DN35247_c0_g1~~TRINITY_DN35247_c0_g1_i1.p1  ORF type:complete len:882 (+),score=191.44 TRINITY_DN35247_c0_g1_i1:356-2647(+)
MASDNQIHKIAELLRTGQADAAVKVAQAELAKHPRCISVPQMTKLVASIGLRMAEEGALKFLDALDALELPDFPTWAAHSYFCRFSRWTIREFLAEAKSAVQMACNMPAHVLERNGVCVQMLDASPGDKGADHLMLSPTSGQMPPGHGFQRGDWLLVTFPHTASPSWNEKGQYGELCLEGEIVQMIPGQGMQVRLIGQLGGKAHENFQGKACRVDRAANHVTSSRQLAAIQKLCSTKNEVLDPLQDFAASLGCSGGDGKGKGKGKGKKKEKKESQPTWLKDVLLAADGNLMGTENAIASVEHNGAGISHHSPLLQECNESQRKALMAGGCRRLTLIQGPPGAGKTTTALLLVRGWVAAQRGPVLCAADSNIAVDNLVSGCAKAGLQVVRVGRPEASRGDLEQYNLLNMVKDSGGAGELSNQFVAMKSILEKADVVCSTCAGADHPVMQDMEFGCVLLDEAGQATELAVLVPLMKMKPNGSVTLVGDHRQLPPTVSNVEVDVEGLGTSLFERLASHGVEPFLLDTQYRMHPAIAAYPSVASYNGGLKSGVRGELRIAPQGIQWPVPEAPVVFLPVDSEEQAEGTSWINEPEVEAVEALLASALAWDDCPGSEIGIITPYAAQARLLRRRLGCPPPGKRAPPGACGAALVEVSSVDGFQGREKDLIIVSTVRANKTGKVGFVGDPRRINVTLTRAKRGIVVCGSFDTLAQDEIGWRPWLVWAQERGLVAGCEASLPEAAEALKKMHLLTEAQLQKAYGPTYSEEK